jgi:hypothetical protein
MRPPAAARGKMLALGRIKIVGPML